jgi:hypothetical protein
LTLTGCPTTDAEFGFSDTIVVVVIALFTVWGCVVELPPLKLLSPPYVAVSIFGPAVVNVSMQLPVATVDIQFTTPSLTVTFPAGVPLPGELTVTL